MKRAERRPLAPADPAIENRLRADEESGGVIPSPEARLRVALVYPNSYAVGMSNLGFHALYRTLNDLPGLSCERGFLPASHEIDWLTSHRRPLASFETDRPLADFDVIAFSVTFEGDYANLLRTLDLAAVPRRAIDRDDRHPLIVVGGIAPSMNPAPLSPFIDAAYIGEARFDDDLVGLLAERHRAGLAQSTGWYVPTHPGPVTRVWNNDTPPHTTVIAAPSALFGDMWLIETGKGCGKHCRFCAAGYVYRPTRQAETNALFAAIDAGIDRFGKVGLMGSGLGDHPDLEALMARAVGRGGSFSVSSLRLDRITDRMLELLDKGHCRTITVAPEAGSERLRRAINKDLSDETILETVERIATAGPFHIKFYFLIGFPGETDDEAMAIVDLMERIRSVTVAASKARGTVGSLTVGVDVFVPKPVTPFQWAPFIGVKVAQKRLQSVGKRLSRIGGVTPHIGSAKEAYLQALLSIGDERTASLIEAAADLHGDWIGALATVETKLMPDPLAERPADVPLPWDFIDHGIRPDYLAREWALHRKEKITPECPPPGESCRRCGVYPGVCIEDDDHAGS